MARGEESSDYNNVVELFAYESSEDEENIESKN